MKTGVLQRAVVAGTAVAILLPTLAMALEMRAGERAGTASSEVVQSDVYLAGGTVISGAAVSGDLSAAGGTIIINGSVAEDILVAGGSITIVGNVGDDLRAAGGTIIVQGGVSGDAVLGGGQIEIGGAGIGGEAAVAGGAVNIEAPIGGALKVAGGEVRINALVVGDVDVRAEKVIIGPKADIQGTMRYTASQEAVIDPAASLSNTPEYTPIEKGYTPSAGGIAALVSLALFAKLLMSLVGAFAIYYFFPRYTKELALGAYERATAAIGIGVVFLIVAPVVALFLLLTIIGIPLGALLLVSYITALIFACITAPILLGSLVKHWTGKKGIAVTWQTILLGVILYTLIGFVPLIGSLAKFIVFILALGSLLALKWKVAKEWR